MTRFRAVVLDTNVIVAALLTQDAASPTARILDRLLEGRIPALLSSRLLIEYRQVLLRPRIQARHGLDEEQIDQILAEIVGNSIVREPRVPGHPSPSPEDQHLWDLLACETGSILVTGDRLLLANPPENASVVSPADFLAG